MTKLKLAVAGCAGRMGRMVCAAAINHDQLELIGGLVRTGSPHDQCDIGTIIGIPDTGTRTTTDADNLFKNTDCIIDFSLAGAIDNHLQAALRAQKPLVIAVTGLSEDNYQSIHRAAQTIPILQAANTSVGINLLMKLVQQTAQSLSDEYDIDISEIHHRHKKDAPSGTSLALARAVHQGHLTPLTDHFYATPSSEVRPAATIGFSVVRSGGYPGDHTVSFASDGEVIELKHRSFNRQIYAQGALQAALWLYNKPAGLYSMQDVLGL